MQLYARWTVAGIITEARELTSPKNKEWRGYIIKVATLGQAFELNVDQKQFHQMAAGQHLIFEGRFDEQRGDKGTFVKYVLDKFTDATQPPVAPKKAGAA